LLATIGTVLLVAFAVTVSLVFLPPKLLDPDWHWQVHGALIANAPLAVLGLALFQLAGYLDPGNARLSNRATRLRSWAGAVALGFLLLVPLELMALVRGVGRLSRNNSRELRQLTANFDRVRRDVQAARDPLELQRRLPPSVALAFGPGALQQPLPQLKTQIFSLVGEAQQRANARLAPPTPTTLWPLLQRSLRVLLLAPVYAVAFAAMAFQRESQVSLLERLRLTGSQGRQGQGRRSRPDGPDSHLRRLSREREDA
jgi:hypothetical protein